MGKRKDATTTEATAAAEQPALARAEPRPLIEIPTSGLISLSADLYHSDPCEVPSLSSSIAHQLIGRSPKHAWQRHPRLGKTPGKPTDATDSGSVVHALLLGQGREMVAVDAADWRTKVAREERDRIRADGNIPVLARHGVELLKAVLAIRSELERRNVELTGESEVAAFWRELTDDGAEVQCRGMFDHIYFNGQHSVDIWDLKTCRSAHPLAIEKHIAAYGYDIQNAAYESGIGKIRPQYQGRVNYRWIFCEIVPPYAVTIAEPAGSYKVLGASKWRRSVETWARCLRDDRWPAYSDDVVRVEAPPWALNGEMSSGMLKDVPFGDDDDEAA